MSDPAIALERLDALEAVRGPLDVLLAAFSAEQAETLRALDPALEPVAAEAVRLVTGGGKRLRPAFVHWGCIAAGGAPDERLLRVAGAVELLHVFALIHDDVMDRSERRRGAPSLHRAMARHHAEEGLEGDADWFGVGAAILAGDLVFVWADALLDQADPPRAAREVFTELRVEVMAGQYLDLRLAGLPDARVEDALRVALLKSGRYTVTRPLLLGAALAGGDAPIERALAAYGDAVGVAFQLRDDVLGLFGDPSTTGKGALGDLREGKRTLLMLRTLERAAPAAAAELRRGLGDRALDAAGAERLRSIVRDSGALDAVEQELAGCLQAALAALGTVPQPARAGLEHLARLAANRLA